MAFEILYLPVRTYKETVQNLLWMLSACMYMQKGECYSKEVSIPTYDGFLNSYQVQFFNIRLTAVGKYAYLTESIITHIYSNV